MFWVERLNSVEGVGGGRRQNESYAGRSTPMTLRRHPESTAAVRWMLRMLNEGVVLNGKGWLNSRTIFFKTYDYLAIYAKSKPNRKLLTQF